MLRAFVYHGPFIDDRVYRASVVVSAFSKVEALIYFKAMHALRVSFANIQEVKMSDEWKNLKIRGNYFCIPKKRLRFLEYV